MTSKIPQVAKRVAIVLAGVFVFGALAATFLPASPEGATCGTWIAPEWDDKGTADLLDKYREMAEGASSPELSRYRGEAIGGAAAVVRTKRNCDDALGTRRTTALVLLGCALVAPLGVVFIAGARKD